MLLYLDLVVDLLVLVLEQGYSLLERGFLGVGRFLLLLQGGLEGGQFGVD